MIFVVVIRVTSLSAIPCSN